MVETDRFHLVLTTALSEMELSMPETGNPSVAWDCHCQMVGARKFINILLNLAEERTEPAKLPNKNLKPEQPLKTERK